MIFTNTGPGSGGVEIFYIGRDGYTRYRFAESATNLGLTTPGSCVGTFSIPLVDDNISRFLCCAWDFFLGPPASVTISPA